MPAPTNPFEMLEQMFDQMSRQFEEGARARGAGGTDFGTMGPNTMGVDLAERDDEYVVTADVPGFEKDEIDLRLTDNTLQIKATQERSTEQEEDMYLRSERSGRSLHERVRLPEPVREGDIEATLQNGVLTVHLPKADPSEGSGRQIEIE